MVIDSLAPLQGAGQWAQIRNTAEEGQLGRAGGGPTARITVIFNMSDMWPRTARPYSRGSLGPEGPQHAVFAEGRPPSILLLQPIGSAPKQTESTRSQDIQDEYWYRAAPFLSSDNSLKLKTYFCIFFGSFQTMWNSL